MHPDVLRDRLHRGLRISGPRDSDYVSAELLGHCNILSARSRDQTDQLSPIRAADPFVDGAFDGLVGGADELGGSSVRPDFAVSGNDVHAFFRRLQWNSPGGAVCGWHLHRHRSGQKFLIDTTNTGWGLSVGHQGDLDLATSGYFFMATDKGSSRCTGRGGERGSPSFQVLTHTCHTYATTSTWNDAGASQVGSHNRHKNESNTGPISDRACGDVI